MREACIRMEGAMTEEFTWNPSISMCIENIVTEVTYLLPEANTVVKVEMPEIMSMADESNCIICGDEVIVGTTYSYDDCEFTCQKTENVGEICRYTDEVKTIISTGA